MTARGDCDVRTDHGVASDVYVTVVHRREVEIAINVFAEMYVPSAPVCAERRLDVAALSDLGKHFFKKLTALFALGGACRVEVIKKLHAFRLLLLKLRICGEIKLSSEHFFLVCHITVPFRS